uniref:Beta-galactosidase n=1 Tax=Acrobeloides nanus TaxID=290746 RepID=A0A914E9G0_9BILA
MIQVENDYGEAVFQDPNYMPFIRDLLLSQLGNDTVLYTADPVVGTYCLKCGTIPGALATVDFGISNDSFIDEKYAELAKVNNGGPIVSTEVWTGLYSSWGLPRPTPVDPAVVYENLNHMYSKNASINIYLIHGGTNFEFTSASDPGGAPGLHNGTTLDGVSLQNWFQCGINLTKASIDSLTTSFVEGLNPKVRSPQKASTLPGVFVGQFTASQLQDTFFDSTGWGKGQLFINGYNLGRYWPIAGPQITLYVPQPIIQQMNTVVLIELVGQSSAQNVANFVDHAIWP